MIKKLFLLITISMIIISGVQAVTIKQSDSEIKNKIEKLTLSEQLIIGEKDDYLSVDLEDIDVKLEDAGKPMLPVYRTTYTFSKNVKIMGISCDYSDIKEKKILGKIIFNNYKFSK